MRANKYKGWLYVESKRRPLYLVADVAGPVQGRATLGFKAEPPLPVAASPYAAADHAPVPRPAERA